jgi:TolA-binding protein
MHPVLRITLYVVLAASAVFFGHRFLQAYSQRVDRAAQKYASEEAPAPAAPEGTNEVSVETTHVLPSATTNALASSNTNTVVGDVTNRLDEAQTNLASATAVSGTNGPVVALPAARPATAAFGLSAALTLASVLGLALLVASDVSHYLASRAHHELYNDEGEGLSSPEYDQAEQAWANGDHMEALRLLRDHLNRHPRALHVAFRIAEIYEKDLANHLAAALEYEEILKHKLAPDRWGWAAIHLCNLYNRLNQPDKCEALLRRIVDEYGETPAAKKARERLGIPEGEVLEAAPETEAPAADGPRLPPGFRPKKK